MEKSSRILIVDDDPAMRSLLSFRLESIGYEIVMCESGEQVQEMMGKSFDVDLVLLDVMLPGISGVDLLVEIKREYAGCQVVVMTAYPSVKMGVDAIKRGAFDFIIKPFDIDQLLQIVKNALENIKLKRENQALRQTLNRPTGFSDLIGKSSKMKAVRQLIRQSSGSRATVLITGESGTGKEIVAKTIHKNSLLHKAPFVVVNCGAIPENLIESELFGYEKGAFTGAVKLTKGKFEQANNGTIFLDEIGELPLNAQVKLLRVLQEKEVVRVGSSESIQLNIRVIAATNRNLSEGVREGSFREDLFYRIALFLIELPNLDDRGADKLLLARHFLKTHLETEERQPMAFSKEAEDLIVGSSWPGNVRQLENCIYRTVLMNPDKELIGEDDVKMIPSVAKQSSAQDGQLLGGQIMPMHVVEAKVIEEALKLTKGNVLKTSQQLEISRVTLYRKMKEYNIAKHGGNQN